MSEVTTEEVVTGSEGDQRIIRKVKIKHHSKLQALVELGKHLGIKDRMDVTSEDKPVDMGVQLERLYEADPDYVEFRRQKLLDAQGDSRS